MSLTALVEHGLEVAGETARRPTNPAIGQRFYDITKRQMMVYTGTGLGWMPVGAGPGSVRLFDHFLGDALDARWSGAAGADGQTVAPTIAAAPGGVVQFVAGDPNDATGTSSLTHALNWRIDGGLLIFETKFKLVSSAANVAVNAGFSDTLATTTVEEPFTLATTTVTSNATNALGFLFDTAATTDTWRIVGVRGDTDVVGSGTDTGIAPTADAWQTLKIVVTAEGVASFYIDGVLVGSIGTAALPVATITTSLTPIITVNSRTTATKTAQADYVDVEQLAA